MSQWRVYLGEHPVVFQTGGVGRVVKGQVFDVPDERVAAFDARSDVGVPPPRRSARKTSSDETASAVITPPGGPSGLVDPADT